MEIIYLLIPLSLILMGLAIWAFFWAVKSGQFDHLDSASLYILQDDNPASPPLNTASEGKPEPKPKLKK